MEYDENDENLGHVLFSALWEPYLQGALPQWSESEKWSSFWKDFQFPMSISVKEKNPTYII